MRSREMLVKLNRLPLPPEPVTCPDISLLSPKDQDRVQELFDKIRDRETGSESTISDKELDELMKLLASVPRLGPDDRFAGPRIEVPDDFAFHWKWRQRAAGWDFYSFEKLGKVETLRFAELCNRYKQRVGPKPQDCMLPLEDWQTDDKAEIQALLDKAADYKEP